MNRFALLALAAVFLSACTQPTQPSTPTTYRYDCQSGERITASYPTPNSAHIEYAGNLHRMQVAVSASGTRYIDDTLEWWTKGLGTGSKALLMQHLPDGSSGEVIESCTEAD